MHLIKDKVNWPSALMSEVIVRPRGIFVLFLLLIIEGNPLLSCFVSICCIFLTHVTDGQTARSWRRYMLHVTRCYIP
jgi:hypothetical protein